MTKTVDLTLAVLLAVPVLAAPWMAGPAAAEDLNRVILRVNDEILTLYDYERRKAGAVTGVLADPQLTLRDRQERIAQLGPQIMQQLFRELLLESRARQLRVLVSENDIDVAIQRIMESQGIPDEASLRQALQQSNMTIGELREKMRGEIIYSEVVSREVTQQIQVGEEELRAYYRNNQEQFTSAEKRWIKEVIVLEASGKSAEELLRLAGEIRAELVGGGELEEVVSPYRDEELTTGVLDLDWLEKGELAAELEDVVFDLQPGAYSEPISFRGGLHILHLAGLQEAELLPFDEVEQQILGRERNRRFDKEMRDYLAKLENQAFIHEDLPPEAVGYRRLASDYTAEEELELFRQEELPTPEDETGETSGK